MLSRSLKRKIVVTCGAVLGFCLLYEATTLDSADVGQLVAERESTALPAPGSRLRFAATAYCRGETTASGTGVRSGIAAADPTLLPVGSVIEVDTHAAKYNGIYTVMDTGPAVQGRLVDIYMWNCDEAVRFGRRPVKLRVLRLGWNPRASDQRATVLFRQREADGPSRERRAVERTDAVPAVAPPRAPSGEDPH